MIIFRKLFCDFIKSMRLIEFLELLGRIIFVIEGGRDAALPMSPV